MCDDWMLAGSVNYACQISAPNRTEMRAPACLLTAAKHEDADTLRASGTRRNCTRRWAKTKLAQCGYVPSCASPFISDESKISVRFYPADCETVRGSQAVLSVYRPPDHLGSPNRLIRARWHQLRPARLP